MSTDKPFTDTGNPSGQGLGYQFADAASRAADKVTELGRAAADSVGDPRDTAAAGIDSAASSLHSAAERLPGGENVSGLAHAAADTLSSTADYVRNADMARMRSDVERVVRNNPGPSLLAAAVVGFVVGRALSHD